MNGSEERIALIEMQIELLKKRITELEKKIESEKRVARAQEGEHIDGNMSVEEILSKFSIDGDKTGTKTRVYNALKRNNFNSLQDMKSMNISKLQEIKYCGPVVAACIYLIMDHYGVSIEIDENQASNLSRATRIDLIQKNIEVYSDRVHFAE